MSFSNLTVCTFLRRCWAVCSGTSFPALSCRSQADLGGAALPVVLILCIPLVLQSSSLSQLHSVFIEETSAHTGTLILVYSACWRWLRWRWYRCIDLHFKGSIVHLRWVKQYNSFNVFSKSINMGMHMGMHLRSFAIFLLLKPKKLSE